MLKYGLRSLSLELAAEQVSKLLSIAFRPHSSSYRGGDYFRAEVPEGAVYLQRNFDVLDDEVFESSWPSDQFLLVFDGLDDEKWMPYTRLLATVEADGTALFLKRAIS
jgi:hypothetical protein